MSEFFPNNEWSKFQDQGINEFFSKKFKVKESKFENNEQHQEQWWIWIAPISHNYFRLILKMAPKAKMWEIWNA